MKRPLLVSMNAFIYRTYKHVSWRFTILIIETWDRPQHRELHALLFFDNYVGSLTFPANHITLKIQATGPSVYSPYLRRLESLIIRWCNYKGSTFFSVIFKTLSVGPAGVELTTSRMTAKPTEPPVRGLDWFDINLLLKTCQGRQKLP